MSHSVANLEHHRFKYERFRRPGNENRRQPLEPPAAQHYARIAFVSRAAPG